MMRFLPRDFRAPSSYRSDNFHIRPLTAEDVELDYDAIMSSQDMLRDWGWPFDLETYTKDADLLAIMSDREKHMRGESFCFAIMNPKDSYCFGSVYLQPLIPELISAQVCQQPEASTPEYGVEVFFWVRERFIEKNFDSIVLDGIMAWLQNSWPFDCVLFSVTEENRRQIELFERKGFPLVYEADEERIIDKLYKWGQQEFYRAIP